MMKPTRYLQIFLLTAFPAIMSLQGCNNNGNNDTVTGTDSTTGPNNAEYNNGNTDIQDTTGGMNNADTSGTNQSSGTMNQGGR